MAGLLVLCVLMSLVLLGAGRASAAGMVQTGLFPASDGLERPQAVAVDQATGDVYLIDLAGAQSVEKFDAAGHPLAFSASASYIDGNQLTGTPTESFRFDIPSAAEIAIDNSGGPFNGDIYVTDSLHHVVDVYAPSGAYLGQLNGSGTPQGSFTEPCGVAVDGSGRVYIGDAGHYVERYTPSSAALPITDGDYTVSELSGLPGEPCETAVDAAGDVFASTWANGPLNEYEASQFPANGEAPGSAREIAANSKAVAVDPSTGRIYVDEGTQIAAYEVSGGTPSLLETFATLSGNSYGLAVDDPGGAPGPTVYVSDEGGPNSMPGIDVFGEARPALPTVADESVAAVTADAATLHAQIAPDFTDTHYRFEYGLTNVAEHSAPAASADAGAGGGLAGVQDINVRIQGLEPDTTYHYRVVLSASPHGTAETVAGSDATFTTQPTGGALTLPDGRIWEMVSPPEKNDSLITGIDDLPAEATLGGLVQAAAGGESIVYASNGAFAGPAGAPLSTQYLARRGASGWSSTNIMPPIVSASYGVVGAGGPYKAFSENLAGGLLLNGDRTPVQNPPLAAGAPAGYQDYYVQDFGTGGSGFQAILTTGNSLLASEPSSEFQMELQGTTPSMEHTVFSTEAKLTSNALPPGGGPNLYEWSAGQLQLVNVLPGGSTGIPGAILGENHNGSPGGLHAISNDGSVVFFTDQENLYARVDGTRTVQVDAAGEGGAESGDGLFQTASGDGSRVFFTDNRRLTGDSTATPTGPSDLYEYDLASGRLADLTVADPHGGGVQRVLGASEDGSYVYFVANGVLAQGATQGHCDLPTHGGGPQTCNLYLWHDGTIKLIASLSEDDNSEVPEDRLENIGIADDWAAIVSERTSRVSPDGLNLVFMSDGDLSGYDSRNAKTGQPEEEVYDYNAGADDGTGKLSCASCDPTGARPLGASSIPAGTQFGAGSATYQSRVLSDQEGRARVFFDSSDALVPQDVNGQQDVYEWEEEGRGNCREAGGCVALISSGTNSSESSFLDASANGSDVFFLTDAQLVGGDTDQLPDIYDAREGGGFPEPVGTSPACEGEACPAPPAQAPALGALESASYLGAGNPAPVKPKPAVKPKRKRKRTKRHKHKAKRRTKRAKRTARRRRQA